MMAGAGVAGFAGAAGWVADGSGVDPGVRLVVGKGAPGGGGGEASGSISPLPSFSLSRRSYEIVCPLYLE